MIDKREIGLKLDGEGFVFNHLALGIGTTLEDFQTEGTLAFAMDMLNSWVKTCAMLAATPLSIFAEMLLGPFDLDMSSSCKRSKTSSSVHNNYSSGQLAGSVGSGSSWESGGRAILKHP